MPADAAALPHAQPLPATPAKAKPTSSSEGGVSWLPHQQKVADFYKLPAIQYFVAVVIVFNFGAIIVEKEIDPYPGNMRRYLPVWRTIDDLCNIIFLIELLINLYGNCGRRFVREPWNYLDVIIVAVGIISLAQIQLPPPADKIKVLRAIRILRVFKRVKSLNKILVALVRSIPGVMNAFAVMLIVMCIFAILAVESFRYFGSPGSYTTVQTYGYKDARWGQGEGMSYVEGEAYVTVENTTEIDAMTARGFHYGQEYFGTFFRSLYTLFQVLTGESWSEAVVRPLLFGVTPSNAFMVGFFFIVYILLTQVVLVNVVVAVLLEEFTKTPEEDPEDEAEAAPSATVLSTTADDASVAALQEDFARIVQQQQLVKDHLQTILGKLQSSAPGGSCTSVEAVALSA